MNTKIIAVFAIAVVVVAAVAIVAVQNNDDFNGVVYDGNGGETVDGDKTLRLTSTNVQVNMFEYENHAFLHWNTKADGSGDVYRPGDKISYPDNGSITLYAQWRDPLAINWTTVGELGDYGFKFITTDEDGNTQNLKKIPYSIAIPKDGDVEIKISDYGDIVWSLNPENGWFTGSIEADGHFTKYTVVISSDDATSTNSLSEDGVPSFKFNFSGPAKITISVEVSKHIIMYYGNGGKTADGQDTVRSTSIVVSDNMFEFDGYEFVCWNTETDGSGYSYKATDTVPTDNNITKLYAQWKENGA